MADQPITINPALEGDAEIIEHRGLRERRRRSGTARIALNLTSMIDVVFLLLIYFMTATQFKLGEEIYRLDLPDRRPSTAQADPFELDEEPLRIMVESIGVRPDDYRLRLDGPYRQPLSFEDLHDYLAAQQVNEQSMSGLFTQAHPIIIQASADTRWEHAMEAFNAAARARYTNIMFAKPSGA